VPPTLTAQFKQTSNPNSSPLEIRFEHMHYFMSSQSVFFTLFAHPEAFAPIMCNQVCIY